MTLREKLIEAGADAMVELPFDTLELRDWGKESIADPARVLSEAALDAMLDVLADGERAEPDYPSPMELRQRYSTLGTLIHDIRSVIDAAIGDKLLVNYPKEGT